MTTPTHQLPAIPYRSWLLRVLPYLLVTLVALLPRLFDLGSYLTHDEAEFWIDRSHTFLRALNSGDFGGTAISTHPGVTTMWLGSIGIWLRETLFTWGWLQHDTYPLFLAFMRLPVVLFHVGALLLSFALLRRLVPPALALLAALIIAADPFHIAYSRLLHVDALLATTATLALLAAACAWLTPAPPRWALPLAALATALALLSKSPALALLPLLALLPFVAAYRETTRFTHALPAALLQLARFGALTVAALLLFWPALWAAPDRVIHLLQLGVTAEGAQPHMTGNFFLGQATPTPDARFYPVVLALRTTPITLLGLLLLPLAWPPLHAHPATRRTLLLLLVFVLLFTLALTPFPKKFNRYLLPVFPALALLAAAGWWGLLNRWGTPQRIRATVLGLLGGLAVLNAALWHPYPIAAYNQLLGGAPAGARTFVVGWGEGFDQVATWLNAQPDITGELTISRMITSLNPYLRKGAQAFFPAEGQLRDNAGYLVVYVSEVQGSPPLPPSDRFYGHEVPLHVVAIHGVEYAWIYQVPPPLAEQRPARFGSWLRLAGFEHPPRPVRGQPFDLTLYWQLDTAPEQDYWLFVHLVGPDGQRYAQVDLPQSTGEWQPGRVAQSSVPLLLPDDSPAGAYQVVLGWYDQTNGQRLPLTSAYVAEPTLGGANALLLTTIVVE